MTAFSYSFSMAILHSLWQGGLLWLLYLAVDRILLQKSSPLDKRNFLFVILSSQVALFVITCCIYFLVPQADITESSFTAVASRFLSGPAICYITPWLFSAYIIVISYKLLKAIYTWYHFKQQYRMGLHKPGIELKLFTELKAYQYGIKRKVKLWLSSSINTPVTFGFFKPVILLPIALLNNITVQQAETLILHELTHIRTNDYVLNWFLLVIENIFFYNPFVISFCKKIRLEREKYCDLSVMAFNYSPAVYAETLLKAERIKQMVPAFQLAAVHKKKQLLHRIHFFTSGKQVHQQRRANLVLPLIVLLMLTLFFSAALFRSNTVVTTSSLHNLSPVSIPVAGYEPGSVVIENDDLPEIKNNALDKLVARVEKQRPMIEKQLKKMQPMIRSIQDKARQIADETQKNFVLPVALQEIEDASKEVMIKEEVSGVKTTAVKIYRMVFENGQWIMVPELMATAKENPDTLSYKKPVNGVRRALPPQ